MESVYKKILCMDGGKFLFEEALTSTAAILSGSDPDADMFVSGLKDTFLVEEEQGEVRIYRRSANTFVKECKLPTGKLTKAHGLHWLVLSQRVESEERGSGKKVGNFLEEFLKWLDLSMSSSEMVRSGMKSFLSLVVDFIGAEGGFVVLNDSNGDRLIANVNLSDKEIISKLEALPSSINQEISSSGIKIILPRELSEFSPEATTKFVKGFSNVAGFPLVAEGKVVAVLYLKFKNIFLDLESEKQTLLELAAKMGGVVIQRGYLREQLCELKERPDNSGHAKKLIIGSSAPVNDLYRQINKLAPTKVSVFIHGPTGSGKELTAREFHLRSNNAGGPFIAVNVAALPESMLESELFGHKKGSFTGAVFDRVGLFEQANGGTLFLDEIAELPLAAQAKVLRALQERVITRVGDSAQRKVDFRLLSASHHDLERKVASGDFREDLFYRIAGVSVSVPGLDDRKEDIPLLSQFFLQRTIKTHDLEKKEFSAEALQWMISKSWPGNIRQLINVVEKSAILSDGQFITVKDLDPEAAESTMHKSASDVSLNEAKDIWLANYLKHHLALHDGNKAKTAKALKVSLRTLFRYIEQLNLEV